MLQGLQNFFCDLVLDSCRAQMEVCVEKILKHMGSVAKAATLVGITLGLHMYMIVQVFDDIYIKYEIQTQVNMLCCALHS